MSQPPFILAFDIDLDHHVSQDSLSKNTFSASTLPRVQIVNHQTGRQVSGRACAVPFLHQL